MILNHKARAELTDVVVALSINSTLGHPPTVKRIFRVRDRCQRQEREEWRA